MEDRIPTSETNYTLAKIWLSQLKVVYAFTLYSHTILFSTFCTVLLLYLNS